MEKITITIPDNLTPSEELAAVAKALGKQMALDTKKSKQKMIGSGYELKHLETQIIVKREPIEKPIVTRVCSVCDTVFEVKLGSPLYVNYGGTVKTNHYCKDECRQVVMDIVGEGRCSVKKKGFKPAYLYNY